MEGSMPEAKKARMVGFNHVALEVGDIEAALAFYARLFDLKLRSKSDSMAFIDLGDQFLALQKGRTQSADDGRHFGLVVDNKEAARTIPDDLHADAEKDERAQSQQNGHPGLSDHPAQTVRIPVRDKHRGGHESHTDQYRWDVDEQRPHAVWMIRADCYRHGDRSGPDGERHRQRVESEVASLGR